MFPSPMIHLALPDPWTDTAGGFVTLSTTTCLTMRRRRRISLVTDFDALALLVRMELRYDITVDYTGVPVIVKTNLAFHPLFSIT
jgi:hypothetical protein